MNQIKLTTALFVLLLPFTSIAQNKTSNSGNQNTGQVNFPKEVHVTASIRYISDIDFVKREYKMELWLRFRVKKGDECALTDLETQIAILEAKEIEIDTIPNWQESLAKCKPGNSPKSDTTLNLRLRCTMIQNWNVSGYPFDKQTLNITIYNPQRSEKWLILRPKEKYIHYYVHPAAANKKEPSLVSIENGWSFLKESAIVVDSDIRLEDPFKEAPSKWGQNENKANPNVQITKDLSQHDSSNPQDKNGIKEIKQYSSIHYTIPMKRLDPWLLFAKLLVGMYVAFLVALIALFINMNETEVRFSLPVGGLFAAIANKYIMESILPQSPNFSLVDWLHSVTIIFIMLIIAYSARDLYLIKQAEEKGTDPKLIPEKKVAMIFAIAYFLISFVLIASNHFYLNIQIGKVTS